MTGTAPPPARSPFDRAATAYHEAGHALAAMLLRRQMIRVSIRPTHELWGEVTFADADHWSETRLRRECARGMVILLAGPLAAARYRGEEVGERDVEEFSECLELAEYVVERDDRAQAEALFLEQFDRAHALVYEPRNWRAIEALAATLLDCETLPARRARAIIRRARSE